MICACILLDENATIVVVKELVENFVNVVVLASDVAFVGLPMLIVLKLRLMQGLMLKEEIMIQIMSCPTIASSNGQRCPMFQFGSGILGFLSYKDSFFLVIKQVFFI